MPSIQNWKLSIRGFLFAWYCADSRDKIPKMLEILMTFHCKLWTLSAKLKFLFTLSAQAPCCCLFFAFPVCHVVRDSFTNTAQERGPEHIPDLLQVQNTKSPCCGLLKNSCNASKVAWNMLFAPKASILQKALALPSAGMAHIPTLCADAMLLHSWPHLHHLPFTPGIHRWLQSKWSKNALSKLLCQLLN